MGKHTPHKGSMAYYPRIRARKQTPSFHSFVQLPEKDGVKLLNFFGYKAGMVHVMGKNENKNATTGNQEIMVPATVIECPAVTVYGVRAYTTIVGDGPKPLGEVWMDKANKHLPKRITSIRKSDKNAKKEKPKSTVEALEKRASEMTSVRLLVHTNPAETTMGQKAPDVSEIALSGSVTDQWNFAKEKLGQELRIGEFATVKDFVDVKSVTKGKGFQGPVKRFGVRDFGSKAKYHRVVGTLGPWNPKTIMFTVAMPGQMGYHNRTEFNKRIILIDKDIEKVNPKSGFHSYGNVKNDYILIAGSVGGSAKRCIALRKAIRDVQPKGKYSLANVEVMTNNGRVMA